MPPGYHLESKVTHVVVPIAVYISNCSSNKSKLVSLGRPHVVNKGKSRFGVADIVVNLAFKRRAKAFGFISRPRLAEWVCRGVTELEGSNKVRIFDLLPGQRLSYLPDN